MSDNGPCYTSESFTILMKDYNVNHITSSPHYPQSNGLAEKYVQIVKNLFYKAKEEGKNLYKCLMVYPNTPLSNSLSSPMQILTSRSFGSSLPMSHAARKEKWLDCENLRTHCKLNTCQSMTYIYIKQSCIKTQLARDGILPPLPSCAKSSEAI